MDNKKYKKNYLSNVLFNLDFTTLSDYNSEKLKEFQGLIKKEFPIVEEVKGVEIIHKLEKAKLPESQTSEILIWHFLDKTKKRIVSFQPDKIVLEFREYNHFEEYFKMIELVIKSLFTLFPLIVSTRVGLRYINQIKLEDASPFEWNNQLNKSLLVSMNFMPDKKDMSRHITLIESNKGDYSLRFQYGIANSLYPSPIMKKEFILDYDCSTFESFGKPEEILDKVKEFNVVIDDMFERSIEDGLRGIMDVVKDE